MLRPMKGRREAKGSKTSVTSELTIPVKAVAILDTECECGNEIDDRRQRVFGMVHD